MVTLAQAVSELEGEIKEIRIMLDTYAQKVDTLEVVVLRGEGDRLPLAEIVRNLTKTVNDYITHKDKEEQKKREQWDKLKWVIIPIIVSGVIAFIIQAIVFYFRIFPLLERLS